MDRGIKTVLALGAAFFGATAPTWANDVTERVGVGMGGVEADTGTFGNSISADGRFVPFESAASNLVAGDTNGLADVFIRDRRNGTTTMVSRGMGGGGGNGPSFLARISADGRFVSFDSVASDLVPGGTSGQAQAYVYDRETGKTSMVSVAKGGAQADQGVFDPVYFSADDRYLGYESSSTNLVPHELPIREPQVG
jgi:hypothetical protein